MKCVAFYIVGGKYVKEVRPQQLSPTPEKEKENQQKENSCLEILVRIVMTFTSSFFLKMCI